MSKDHLLALDQGTSSSRAIVFHRSGRVVALAQREFTQHFPQPGWVEHDADEIWDTQLAVAREALAKSGLQAADIAAIGITNQRETTVLWRRASGRRTNPNRPRPADATRRAPAASPAAAICAWWARWLPGAACSRLPTTNCSSEVGSSRQRGREILAIF